LYSAGRVPVGKPARASIDHSDLTDAEELAERARDTLQPVAECMQSAMKSRAINPARQRATFAEDRHRPLVMSWKEQAAALAIRMTSESGTCARLSRWCPTRSISVSISTKTIILQSASIGSSWAVIRL